MKRLSKFSGIVASLFLILFFVALGASPVMAADKYCSDPKWADHPLCIDDPVDPPPEPEPDPGDPCSTSVETDPAIVYLTATEKTGPRSDFVYTRDLMLASADGCHKTMLIEHAAQWLPDTKKNEGKDRGIKNVSGVRLVTYGYHGVVSWYNTYQDPWTLEYLEFDFDSVGNISLSPDGQQSYSSIRGSILEQDIRILENGDLVAATIETPLDSDYQSSSIVVRNLITEDEQVLSSGTCHYTDPDENCYKPMFGKLVWDPTGEMLYVDMTYTPEEFVSQRAIVRYEFEQTSGWSGPRPIVTTFGADPIEQDLSVEGVSLDGLIAYTFWQDRPNIGSDRRAGILDPEECLMLDICNGVDGIIEGVDDFGAWTAEDTILSEDNGNLVEYLDPLGVPSNTRILIQNIASGATFDSDL